MIMKQENILIHSNEKEKKSLVLFALLTLT